MKKLIFLITLTVVLGNSKLAWGMEAMAEPPTEEARARSRMEWLKGEFSRLGREIHEKEARISELDSLIHKTPKNTAERADALKSLQRDSIQHKIYEDELGKINADLSKLTRKQPSLFVPATSHSPSAVSMPSSSSARHFKEESKPRPPARRRPAWRRPLFAVAGAAAATAALYATLKWYQRRSISRILAPYKLKISQFSSAQKDILATALMARRHIPGSLRKLAALVQRPGFSSEVVPTATMWRLITELYYGETPTDERVASVKAILASQR